MCNRLGKRKRLLQGKTAGLPFSLKGLAGYCPNPSDFVSSVPSSVRRTGVLLLTEHPDGSVQSVLVPDSTVS